MELDRYQMAACVSRMTAIYEMSRGKLPHISRRASVMSLSLTFTFIAMVQQTIRAQSDQDWSKEYSGVGAHAKNRLDMIMQCAAHMQHHIGQMIYLVYEWQRQKSSKIN